MPPVNRGLVVFNRHVLRLPLTNSYEKFLHFVQLVTPHRCRVSIYIPESLNLHMEFHRRSVPLYLYANEGDPFSFAAKKDFPGFVGTSVKIFDGNNSFEVLVSSFFWLFIRKYSKTCGDLLRIYYIYVSYKTFWNFIGTIMKPDCHECIGKVRTNLKMYVKTAKYL